MDADLVIVSTTNMGEIRFAPDVGFAGRVLQNACYEGALKGGWHNSDKGKGPLRTPEENEAMIPLRLLLIHSEISEAMEGHRKNLQDDKLPHRKMIEVELADAAIRIFDLAGVMGYDVAGAIAEKLAYNAQRADHKPENRAAAGGKAY